MRLSCNGCRVLRKGCTEACTIRPCLQWIKAPDAQSNATVFLAKFYGRAGLLNLIDAAPGDEQRPAVFRSLLYEACGRIVNPIYGSVGLLWSGKWHLCQAAVEAVLKGTPIVQISSEDAEAAAPSPAHLHKAAASCYDIRHVAKPLPPAAGADAVAGALAPASSAADAQSSKGGSSVLHKVAKPGRTSFKKRASSSPSSKKQAHHSKLQASAETEDDNRRRDEEEAHLQLLADHALSDDTHHHQEASEASLDTDAEVASHVTQAEQATVVEEEDHLQEQQQQQHPGLDLTLGFGVFAPVAAASQPTPSADAGCSNGGWTAAEEPGVVGFRFL
ncbi:LOB domain-containing protein 41 [Dichanthelium oligosanthes]|uniref:LOB domain-containing protein 41 n=1 Tax=Dichanthelium oligosanthes TaxID=888268 RepID=A0A1E5VY00_9POAL|nr:LOB domain-containing protein 41 [Dichanthelium oligosanthes]